MQRDLTQLLSNVRGKYNWLTYVAYVNTMDKGEILPDPERIEGAELIPKEIKEKKEPEQIKHKFEQLRSEKREPREERRARESKPTEPKKEKVLTDKWDSVGLTKRRLYIRDDIHIPLSVQPVVGDVILYKSVYADPLGHRWKIGQIEKIKDALFTVHQFGSNTDGLLERQRFMPAWIDARNDYKKYANRMPNRACYREVDDNIPLDNILMVFTLAEGKIPEETLKIIDSSHP